MRATWDETWLTVADAVARRSPCERRQCGAVVVDRTQRIVATGYNGFPARLQMDVPHTSPRCVINCPRGSGRSQPGLTYDDCLTVHAETNAIAFCDRRDRQDGTIYVTSAICLTCAKLLANSGLVRVVMRVTDADEHREPERGIAMLHSSGLTVDVMR